MSGKKLDCNSDDPDDVAAALSDKIPEVELLMDVEELLNIVNGGKARDPNLTVQKDSKDVQALLAKAKQRCFILQNLDDYQEKNEKGTKEEIDQNAKKRQRVQHEIKLENFYKNVMEDLKKIGDELQKKP